MGDVRILTLADRGAWESAYRDRGLPSHSWYYAFGLSKSGYEPQLAIVEAGDALMILPFFERSWREFTDIATLPSLSGALLTDNAHAPLELWRTYARDRGWITGYIQLALANEQMTASERDEIVAHNAVFLFDLTAWSAEDRIDYGGRRSIALGSRMGASIETDRETLRQAIQVIYPEAMARLQSSQIFTCHTLDVWFDDPDALAIGAAIDGTVHAVHLGRWKDDLAEWHIAATTATGRSLGNWLIWQANALLQAKGIRTSNIGGGKYIGDGVYNKKMQIGASVRPLRSLRQIYRRDVFEFLCREAGSAETARFPPYRVGQAHGP